jgi:hypothetical protein
MSRELAEDVWIVGQELHDSVWDGPFAWDFGHLLSMVRAHLQAHPLSYAYIFGSSEPQQFSFPNEIRVIPIPVMIAVFCDAPVPSMLGITSVQSSTEKIVAMKDLKMSWCPWRASERLSKRRWRECLGDVSNDPTSPSSPCASTSLPPMCSSSAMDGRIFVLHCTMRNGGRGRYIDDSKRKEFEYALPFVLRRSDVPRQPEPVTHVAAVYIPRGSCEAREERSGKLRNIEFGFDKDVDRTQLFIPEFIEEHGLDEAEYDAVKDCIKAAFAAARAAEVERVTDLQQRHLVMPAEIDDMVVRKVYPRNPQIDAHFKTPFVNRYYGTAEVVL